MKEHPGSSQLHTPDEGLTMTCDPGHKHHPLDCLRGFVAQASGEPDPRVKKQRVKQTPSLEILRLE